MPENEFSIRTMSPQEVNFAVDLAANEGWNPGLHDADAFFAADPGGFLLGELDGEPIATISVVEYGDDFGFLGFYIVRPGFRGQGFGLAMWNAGMQRLAGRNIGLDGVVDQQPNYRKSGFQLAYRNVRYEGRSGGVAPDDGALVDLSTVPAQQVYAYDRRFFPAERRRFLEAWLQQPASVALGIIDEGVLKGYGLVRSCRSGFKIGPLFADTPDRAETLFRGLCAKVEPDQPVYLDVPEPNRSAVALAERAKMHVVFETARMYTGPAPDLPLQQLFGVTSFELG